MTHFVTHWQDKPFLMANYRYSLFPNDTSSDTSDVQSLLLTIDRLYLMSRSVLNSHTQTSLLMAIAIEGQMLQAKLRMMGRRWRIHLPFKESCQVEFYDWAKRMEAVSDELKSDGEDEDQEKRDIYCPSKHFLLDLYAMLPETVNESASTYYEETDVSRFVQRQETMRRMIANSWKDYVQRVSDQTISDLSESQGVEIALAYEPLVVRNVCSDVLRRLSDELFALNARLTNPISKKDFTRLADRILKEREYGGTKALARAKALVNTWRNETPYDMIETERQAEIDRTIEQIGKTKYGGTFLQNVRINDDFDRQKERFGKFLFSVRKSISKDELVELFGLIFRIYHLRHLPETVLDETDDTDITEPSSPQDAVTVKPQPSSQTYPDLPVEFVQPFRDNPKAVVTFYRLLLASGPYIGRARRSKAKTSAAEARFCKWKWPHLQMALVKIGLLTKNAGNREFADFMSSVFPDRSSDSIYRALYRPDGINSVAIVADIAAYFRPVREHFDSPTKMPHE